MEEYNDIVYLYDGSFSGFLCCVFEAVARREQPFAVWAEDASSPTLYPIRLIQTRSDRAGRVFRSIGPKMGPRAKSLVSRVFLSGDPDKETLLVRFFVLGYKIGPNVCKMLGHPAVAEVFALERQVLNEAHYYTEFLRFQQAEDMLISVIEPKSYVLPLLKIHVCDRFPDENLLIADRTHGAALLYRDRKARYLALTGEAALPEPDENEARYQQMWKAFYRTIAIRARENPALRRSHCPKRYWHCMTEMKDLL